MAQQEINPGSPPILWSDVASAFENINDNFTELYASIGGDAVDFTSLGTNLVPRTTEIYDLGTSTKKWKDLWLSGSSLHLGDATITSIGTTVNLPIGSTIGGLRVDENYFKFIAVSGQDNIEADDGTDTLTIAAGNTGITLTTDSISDTLTITNSGVTSLSGTTGQIGVNQSTGGVTLTNLGVTKAIAGFGITVSQDTGDVTIVNDGVIGIDAGVGIVVSTKDPLTGRITVTNSQPNITQNVFSTIIIPGQPIITADTSTDTLTLQVTGDGLSLNSNAVSDIISFSNTGVTALAVGNGLSVTSNTGNITLSLDQTLTRNIVGDVTGSVFGHDSTPLIDATESKIIGPIVSNDGANTVSMGSSGVIVGGTNGAQIIGAANAPVFIGAGTSGSTSGTVTIGHGGNDVIVNGTLTASLSGNVSGNVYGTVYGNVLGSVFSDDSSGLLVDGIAGELNTYKLAQIGATNGQALIWNAASERWEPATVAGGGGGTLDALADVDTSSTPPTNGQTLIYDNSVSLWKPGSISGGGISLTSFSVGADDPASGNGGLAYDNTTGIFTYTPPDLSPYLTGISGSQLNSISIDEMSDVDTTSTTPNAGDALVWNNSASKWEPGSVSGLQTRNTANASTTSIADGASEDITITGYKGYLLYKIQTSAAAWVRIYTDTASRTADAARSELTDPDPGAGVVAEVITSGAETVLISPGAIGFSNESTPSTDIPVAVTNKSGGAVSITVTVTILQMEA